MSNELAIAAVTTMLRDLLTREADATIAGTPVTTRPPDAARDGHDGRPQLNLFLYHTAIDPAWRNMDSPGADNGETTFPPLPLTLHYLVTAYGGNNDNSDDHRLLGAAMRTLYDHPLLGRAELRARLPESGLHRQVERVRITNQPLSLEEMSKLWTTFQTQYRVSAAFEVSVVLIDSTRTSAAPPPVLTRGVDDVGPDVRPTLVLPIPTLESITPESVKPGDDVTLAGHDLGGDTIRLRLHYPVIDPVLTAPAPAPAGGPVTAALPADVPAGKVDVELLIERAGNERPVPLPVKLEIRPTVTSQLPLEAQRDASGRVNLTVAVTPQVRSGQDARLLVFGRQIPAEPIAPAGSSTLTFDFPAPAGTTPMRIRIDGADSELIAATTPPSYHADQKLVVT